jgi:membrane associated rhomboid family serine protease
MEQLSQSFESIVLAIKHNSFFVLKFIALLWIIQLINFSTHYKLNVLGIYPRRIRGLIGIICSPFIHGDFSHLLLNSVPLFVLANLVLLKGETSFYIITLIIIILGNLAVWLFAKRGIHIGASGVIMGYFGFLLANAYYQFNTTALILAILCVYYFSGLILLLIPGGKGISWEGHIFGFLAGIAAIFTYPFIVNLIC